MRISTLMLIALGLAAGCGREENPRRPTDYQGPWLELAETDHDFGDLFFEHDVSHVFVVRNRGTETLRIEDVRKDCGCLDPVFSKRTIEPGGEATMTVGFHAIVPGPHTRRIHIYTNDPYAADAVITLRARGLGPARLEPSSVDLRGVVPRGGMRRRLSLRVPDETRVVGVRFDNACPWLSLEPANELGGTVVEVELTLRDVPGPMSLRERVDAWVTTEDANGRRRTFALPTPLQVTGRVRPEHWATPTMIQLVGRAPGTSLRRRVRIEPFAPTGAVTVRASGDVEVVNATQIDDEWDLVLRPRRSGRFTGRIEFSWPGGRATVPVHGWVPTT